MLHPAEEEEPAKKIARPDLARSGSQTGTLIVAEGGGRASDCAIPLSLSGIDS